MNSLDIVPDLEPVCFSMSGSNCCFLTCIQISQEAGKVVWYPISWRIFQFFVIPTVKGFGIIDKTEVDVFLGLSCFFDDPMDVGNLISGSSAFSKSNLNIWKFTVHVLVKPGLKNFEHYFASEWDECNCAVVWAFFHIAFLWDWNENWPFPVFFLYIKQLYIDPKSRKVSCIFCYSLTWFLINVNAWTPDITNCSFLLPLYPSYIFYFPSWSQDSSIYIYLQHL